MFLHETGSLKKHDIPQKSEESLPYLTLQEDTHSFVKHGGNICVYQHPTVILIIMSVTLIKLYISLFVVNN